MMVEQFAILGLTVPIFAFSHCRDVVVAVSKAGGIGVYGASLHSDAQIAEDLRWIEGELNGLPYAVDLMMPGKYVGSDEGGLTGEALRASIPPSYFAFLDDMMARHEVPVQEGWGSPAYEASLPGQRYTAKQADGILDVAFSFSPKLLVSALGTPPEPVIARAHGRGMLVGALAGKVKHALKHKQAGVDIVVAQSYEAGGHTGDIGGMVLTPQVVDAVAPIPVLAAGGIATGRQMAAALALGAQGVWCGSVWLTTGESECSPLVRQKLIDATTEDTLRTRAFTGKPARYLRSAWVDEWESPSAPSILPNPLHSAATDRYIDRIDHAAMSPRARADSGAGRLATKPAGQVIGLINSQSSCRNVVMDMMTGCVDALDGVQERLELK
jgi:NAD(P)H-dependent flavin oxidoreductase YrpB (nitropropane dioxygenase family)